MASDARQRIPQLTNFEEGSVVRSLFESFAVELATLYEQMDLVYQAGFVDTAQGAHLDRVVAVLGIKRNEPDFASGIVTFQRDPGSTETVTIPIGSLVTTKEDASQDPPKKAYLTIEEGNLAVGQNSVDVKVQAEVRGRQMSTDANTVIIMPLPVPGVKSVTNEKPIHFLGRDRETDEALRQRAKTALLASGRASSTSIENALLSMPGVREVRIKEDPAKPGVIQIYVDGLTDQNQSQLSERIDQVRAAGVYVLLDPALAINLEVVLHVAADARVVGDERLQLEKQVGDAVEFFINRVPMGQPLLFSQLTGEVLKIKGVTDLLEFHIQAQRTAQRPGDPPPPPELYETKDKRIEASLYERFVPHRVRAAADIKNWPVNVQAQIVFPEEAAQTSIISQVQGFVDTLKDQTRLSGSNAVKALPPAAQAGVIEALRRFFEQVKAQANTLTNALSAGIDASSRDKLVAAIQTYFAAIPPTEGQGGGKVVAAAIQTAVQQLDLGTDLKAKLQTKLTTFLSDQLETFIAGQMETFPSEALTNALRETATSAYDQQLKTALQTQEQALQKAQADYQAQANAIDYTKPKTDWEPQLAALQKTLKDAQDKANQDFNTAQNNLAAVRDKALSDIPGLVAALQAQTNADLLGLIATNQLTQLATQNGALPPYQVKPILLRASLYSGEVLTSDSAIEASFVEKPVAGILFVYNDRLELEGNAQLALPLKATSADKDLARQKIRQELENYLENLALEEAVDLEQIAQIASSSGPATIKTENLTLVKVTGDQRTPLPGRNDGRKITVNFGEKVFLARTNFVIAG